MSKKWFSAVLAAVLLTVFLAPAAVLADDVWICTNCGQENDANFCIYCGAARPETAGNGGSPLFSLFPGFSSTTNPTDAPVPDVTVTPKSGGTSLYPGWNIPFLGPEQTPGEAQPTQPAVTEPAVTEAAATPASENTSFFSG